MRIGEVAEKLGIPASTIRYYEKKELIKPPERVSGHRVFAPKTLTTLRFIQLSQAVGFTIEEIRDLLQQFEKDPTTSGPWWPAAQTKRESLRAKIQSLQKMDAILDELMRCRCRTVVECVESAVKDDRWQIQDND